ncbi:MAG: serine hydrolase [Candidatus Saccharimonadales bacterium]
MKKFVFVVLGILALGGAFFGGYGLTSGRASSLQPEAQLRGQTKFPLLAKRLFMDNPNDSIMDLAPIRKEVKAYIDKNIGIENASVYFEYLPTGVSFDPGNENTFVAASLLKVPQVMNLYKAVEFGYVSMDDEIALKKEWLDSGYGTLYKKGAGHKLTLREAARLATIESDNTAINAIQQTLHADGRLSPDDQAMNFIDTDYALNKDNKVLIGSGTYSAILKCLYFSCYLKPEHSQELLRYMTESQASNRLRAGVPADVSVAHKIGTFSQEVQSDCGIVYVPNRNYILCVMLKQPDEVGSKHIAVLSEAIYKYISRL